MWFIFAICFSVLFLISWIVWSIVAITVFFAAVGIPWGIWVLFLYLTFNNLINLIAKIRHVGPLLGFILTLPFAGVSVVVTVWAYVQVAMMGILTFRGYAGYGICNTFIEDLVEPWEKDLPYSFVIARYYYEHMQWLWGGAGFMGSYFPWENGVMVPVHGMGVIGWCVKLFFLALPYMALFVLPLLPVLWSFSMPILGALSHLPAVSGNGNGRD